MNCFVFQMVKVTNADKPDPIVTRSVAAKEAIHRPDDGASSFRHLKNNISVVDNMADAGVAMPTPSTSPFSFVPKPPPALDSHNYAKSPIVEMEDAENMDCDVDVCGTDSNISLDPPKIETVVTLASFEPRQLQTMKTSDVKVAIAVSDGKGGSVTMPTTISNTDVTKPLTIQTKFSTISCGPESSSTDTASEVGSCMSSPVCSTGQPSPSCYSPQKTRSPADTALALARMAAKLSIVKKTLTVKVRHGFNPGRGVDPDEKMGTDRFVTQPFATGVWGHCKPPAVPGTEPRRQTYFDKKSFENLLQFMSWLPSMPLIPISDNKF